MLVPVAVDPGSLSPVALGALAPDPVSSTCYGTEQILLELVPAAGMAAFVLLLPITGVILLILVLVAASYRQVVMAYTAVPGCRWRQGLVPGGLC